MLGKVVRDEVTAVKGSAFASKMNAKRKDLRGGLVGAVDYSTGENAVMVKLCAQWCTMQLAKVDAAPCTDLAFHFSDGVALADLLKALTDRTVKVKKNAKLPALQMDNVQRCIDLINACV